jgi:hypothetical protein
MKATPFFTLMLAGTVSLTLPMPLLAVQPANIVVSARANIRDIEYSYAGQERMQKARSMLTSMFPAGSSVATATKELSQSGAHCRPDHQGLMSCTFSGFEGVDDHLHDVVWTVRLNAQGGKISDLNVTRDSIGS